MAITNFNCCLNPPPPTQNLGSSPSLPSKPNQVLAWNKNDGSWTKRCVLGMTAGIMIGLEMGSLDAIAKGMPLPLVTESSDQRVTKWSDKRMCPPWIPNSLETIVPENLPRPSAQRRSEVVGFSKDAPAVKAVVVRRSGGCFAM
ncbi:PREDICTED: forkhead box L2 [Prunus dulcis]|uniref:PREDICTED: forkhead box L2 n=1 Tax=Prunus dulcis TaxID=3755 RepID=A0A5E4EJC6_PRUDU|nr:uncharacterized protein LOC117615446 [Prunus dulcis]VVA15059.1 PREDICTED: forkhead box L2 [Prunus dulcis]